MARAARLTAALLGLALAGCGDTPAGEALRVVTGAPGPEPAPASVEGPALLLLSPIQATLRPVQGTGPRRLWRGGDGLALMTEGARVVATAGLGQMLMATRLEGPDPLEEPRALLGTTAAARRQVDLSGAEGDPASMRFGVILDCALGARAEGEWLVVEERCAVGETSFTNRFWAPAAGGPVLRSEQWVGDAAGPVVIQAAGLR